MNTQTTNAKTIYWKKVLHFTFRFALTVFILLFRLALAIATFIIRFFVALFDTKDDEDKKHDTHGGSTGEFRQAIGFERNGPFKHGVPKDTDE